MSSADLGSLDPCICAGCGYSTGTRALYRRRSALRTAHKDSQSVLVPSLPRTRSVPDSICAASS